MECSYSFDRAENLLRVSVWGDVTVDGMIDMIRRSGRDPAFSREMNVVVDLRESSGNWDYTEIQRYRDFLARVPGREQRRWAAIVSPGSLAAVAHIVMVISQPAGHRSHMRLFEDLQPAMQWLSGGIDD